MVRTDKVLVNLIGYDGYALLEAYLGQPLQFFPAPYPPYRVVRAAEQQQLGARFHRHTFELFEVDCIPAALFAENKGSFG